MTASDGPLVASPKTEHPGVRGPEFPVGNIAGLPVTAKKSAERASAAPPLSG
jgi:hypothetical protein